MNPLCHFNLCSFGHPEQEQGIDYAEDAKYPQNGERYPGNPNVDTPLCEIGNVANMCDGGQLTVNGAIDESVKLPMGPSKPELYPAYVGVYPPPEQIDPKNPSTKHMATSNTITPPALASTATNKLGFPIKDAAPFVDKRITYGESVADLAGPRHCGPGTRTWEDGSRYEGQWENGAASGFGKLSHADGDIYEGSWQKGMAHGEGVYWHIDGGIYRGQWDSDLKGGQGVEEWPDGARFEGEYKSGWKHGVGTFLWPNGSSFHGSFAKDEFSGEGCYRSVDGRWYSGSWKAGKMNGKGRYVFPDGRQYVGEYKEGLRHGSGTFVWEDGRKYEGEWHEDKEHGKGSLTSADGEDRHEGVWTHGKNTKWTS